MSVFLWAILPYIAFTLLIGGLIWRWRTDQFGWTSRSSQLHEHAILRAASPLFHFGILFVAAGHIMGLVFPMTWTQQMGISQHAYHLIATIGGTLAGLMTLVGLVGLLYRRFVNKSIRLATTPNDIIMYILLTIPICLGAFATAANQIFGPEGGYNYRETISVWFRSIFTFHPNIELMTSVPLSFQLHIIAGLILFAVLPFTRLVHMVSAPVAYPTRPWIVYRSREGSTVTAQPRRGWKPVSKGRQKQGEAHSLGA
ncbi:MAG: respiratory nitrate reductase subunit gamma [Actinomycetaceae bacterium]|nr:respiratory nitrate reductase subunit gamma [Actinomycetaceae bacterium]